MRFRGPVLVHKPNAYPRTSTTIFYLILILRFFWFLTRRKKNKNLNTIRMRYKLVVLVLGYALHKSSFDIRIPLLSTFQSWNLTVQLHCVYPDYIWLYNQEQASKLNGDVGQPNISVTLRMDAKVSIKTKTKTFQNLNKNCPLVIVLTFAFIFIA